MPLKTQDLAWYQSTISKYDPQSKVVKLDISNGNNAVVYSSKIESDESNTRPITPEEVVHATVAAMLCSSKYGYSEEKLIHERRIRHGSKGSLSDEIDFILKDDDDMPFAIFELKSAEEAEGGKEDAIKWQLFGTAPMLKAPRFLVFATVHPANPPKLDATVIDYSRYPTYDHWVDDGRPSFSEFPKSYSVPEYKAYANNASNPLNSSVSQSDLKAIAQSIHNQFFSEHPDNQLYVNIVKIMLAKIHDELTTKRDDEYRIQIKRKNGKEQSAQDVFDVVNEVYKAAYKSRIDKDGDDDLKANEFAPESVKSVVRMIAGISLTKRENSHGDFIGTFFEEILRDGFRQDRGMYFTHSNLVDFMVRAVNLEQLTLEKWSKANHPDNYMPYIIDPACGSGAFLLRAMDLVTYTVNQNKEELTSTVEGARFYGSNFNPSTPNGWAAKFIYGFDPKFIMAITCKVNMVLHGDGSSHIFKDDAFRPLKLYKDALLNPNSSRSIPETNYRPHLSERFDLVISNPPFGITLQPEVSLKLSDNFILSDSSTSEALFIERSFQLLRPNGRLAIVIPESLLNSPDNIETRLLLIRLFKLKAVISLPRNVFIDTPTLTSILLAQRKTGDEILRWDSEFSAKEAEINSLLLSFKSYLSGAIKSTSALTTADIYKKAQCELPKIIGDVKWFIKGGKRPQVVKIYDPGYLSLDERDIIEVYREIIKISDFRDAKYRKVLSLMDKDLFTSHYVYSAKDVGFKLSKRKERDRPNDLVVYKTSAKGDKVTNLHLSREVVEAVIDTSNHNSILDAIRSDIIWEEIE